MTIYECKLLVYSFYLHSKRARMITKQCRKGGFEQRNGEIFTRRFDGWTTLRGIAKVRNAGKFTRSSCASLLSVTCNNAHFNYPRFACASISMQIKEVAILRLHRTEMQRERREQNGGR